MTIFITELFKLDLTHLKITFSEENTFFEKDLIKQQSFPFKIPKERSFIPFFEFVSSHNSTETNKIVPGILFRNDKYYQAELLVLNISATLDAIFYYSADKLTIFDLPLKSLPWPVLDVGNDMYQFAKNTIAKDYPATLINFSEVHHPEKHKDNDWGNYAGIINNNIDGDFQRAIANPFSIANFFIPVMNEMRPFIYQKEIIKFIFSQIDYTVIGDFESNASIGKALQYHDNSIFYTNEEYSSVKNILPLTTYQSNISGYSPATVIYNKYINTLVMVSEGYYNFTLSLKGTFTVSWEEIHVKVYFDNQLIGAIIQRNNNSASFDQEIGRSFYIPFEDKGKQFRVEVICSATTKYSLEGGYEIVGCKMPLYRDTINLSDLCPDVTVGEYVKNFKESYSLNSVFDPPTKTVSLIFFNSLYNNDNKVDLHDFMIENVNRSLNKSVGFKINFTDGEILYLTQKGVFIPDSIGFEDYNISIQPLQVFYPDGNPAVKHQDSLSILFFESNVNARPLVEEGDIKYSRLGFIHQFLRSWLFQLLNSEEYSQTINLPIYIASKITAESLICSYNNNFLVHTLKRKNVNSLFEQINIKLFKLKSYRTFNAVIDDGSGNPTYLPPVAFVSDSAFNTNLITDFSTQITPGVFANPSSFAINIFANKSTDPQNLDLSYSWEVVSSPNDSGIGSFAPQNTDHSITRFFASAFLLPTGDYYLKLTVVNSVGLLNEILIKVVVSSVAAPTPPKIILNKLVDTDNSEFTKWFGISFDNYSTSSVNVIIQKFDISTQSNIGSEINYGVITDFTLPHHEVTFPSSGTWALRVVSTDEVSNEIAWFGF